MESTTSLSARKSDFGRAVLSTLATRFNAFLCGMAFLLLLLDVWLGRAVDLHGLSAFLSNWPAMVLIVACAIYCITRPLPRLTDACICIFWGMVLSNLLSPLILIAGRSPRPLVDWQLYAVDRWFHFSTAAVVHFAAGVPLFRSVLAWSYPVPGPLVIVALLAPPIFGKAAASRQFLLAAAFCATLTAALFAWLPAAGPWTTEHYPPSAEQARVTAYLQELKSTGPVAADANNTAIVSFPSFHVALALVTAVALGSLRPLRIPVWIVTGMVCVSTLTTGWHYAIDLVGGLAVAVASVLASRRLEPRLQAR